MKAVVKTKKGIGNVELMDVKEPEVGPNQVKIEVKAAGICGTDIHIYYDEFRYKPPVILGHEFCGVVAEVGENVTEFKIGDRVTSETTATACGKCVFCKSGRYNLCPERQGYGYDADGAFAKYCVVRREGVHKLSHNVDFISGALCEPLSVCTHGVLEMTEVKASDFVVITGPGPIGLLTLQLAKAAGASTIVITGTSIDKERLTVAKKLGADYAINVEEEDPVKLVMDLTDGYGADVVFECSGAAPACGQALEIVKKAGQITQIGIFGRPIQVNFDTILYKELRVTGTFSHVWTAWEKALRLLSEGRVKTKPLVTDIYPLERWREAFEKFEKKIGLKIVLTP